MRSALLWLVALLAVLAGCIGAVNDPEPMNGGDQAPSLTAFPRNTSGLADSQAPKQVVLEDGDTYELTAGYVKHDPGTGEPIRMMAYNGMIPGPQLRMAEGAEVDIAFTNELDQPTTVHWHGLRLDNEFDGVPNLTQSPVAPGESFTYTIKAPDAGLFWYHPHIRTDVQKELGLYGSLVVDPPREDTEIYPKEHVLHLDDIRLEDGDVPHMYEQTVAYADSGRWGNQPFVNGAQAAEIETGAGERHRLHLVNTANARTWRLDFQGFDEVEKIATGASYLEEPRAIEGLRLGPAERAIVDIELGPLESGRIVDEETTWPLVRASSTPQLEPEGLPAQQAPAGPHERAQAEDRGSFLEQAPDEQIHVLMQRNETSSDPQEESREGHSHDEPVPPQGIVNPFPSTRELEWTLIDAATGEDRPRYSFHVGDVVSIELEIQHEHGEGGDHAAHVPVPHTMHLHGQRFLVESYGQQSVSERAWKDTVLANDPVEDYQTTTIRVEFTNPGTWLLHCHISEHSEAGMTIPIEVLPTKGSKEASRILPGGGSQRATKGEDVHSRPARTSSNGTTSLVAEPAERQDRVRFAMHVKPKQPGQVAPVRRYMKDEGWVSLWGARVAVVAGAMLAIARFGTYVDIVTDTDVDFLAALGWWGGYVGGVGLLAVGAVQASMAEEVSQRAWVAMLVGLVLLVLLPAAPGPSFDFGNLFGP